MGDRNGILIMKTNKKQIGRPKEAGDKKKSYTISLYNKEAARIVKRYGSLTKYVDDCIMRDGIRKTKTA